MKTIPLSKGQHAIVDDDDYETLAAHKWYAYEADHTFYAVRDIKVNKKKKCVWMHRVVNATPVDMLTDHIDGNGLDNRRSNLRSVVHRQNMLNCARHKPSSSNYRGVSWHIANKRWYAQITYHYKNIYIGSFGTQEAAKAAYDAKRAELLAGELYRKD